MRALILLFSLFAFNVQAAVYNFEDLEPGPFRKIELPGLTIEAGFDDVAFVGSDIGRPAHFGVQSIYTSGELVLTFNPMISGSSISGSPYPSGKAHWKCDIFDTQTNKPHPYPMQDTTAVELVYGQFDNLFGSPARRYKVVKCIVSGLDKGIWIDFLATAP